MALEVLFEQLDEGVGRGQGAMGRVRFGWPGHGASSGATGDLFGDDDGELVEVDPTDSKTGTFPPAEAEDSSQIDHRFVSRSERLTDGGQLLGGQNRPVDRIDCWQEASALSLRQRDVARLMATRRSQPSGESIASTRLPSR